MDPVALPAPPALSGAAGHCGEPEHALPVVEVQGDVEVEAGDAALCVRHIERVIMGADPVRSQYYFELQRG